jgi:hypothetical protein
LNKKKNYEYKIISHFDKESFLEYIKFELNFLELIKTRTIVKELEKSESFIMLLKGTERVFLKSTKKFREDEVLWKSFIDFGIMYSFKVEEIFERYF